MVERKNWKKRWLAVGLIALGLAVSAAVWLYVGKPLVNLASDSEAFRAWVEKLGWRSRFAFMGIVILQVIVAAIPGEPFEIAAGYAFGVVEGTILCIAAAAIGSILVFWLVRKFGMKLVRVFFSEEKVNSVKFLKTSETSETRDFLFLIVYMLPGTPKDLLGYFAGITDIPFSIFCLICTLGRIPSVITSTISGNALGTKNYTAAIISFSVTLAISGIGLLVYKKICKRNEEKNTERK